MSASLSVAPIDKPSIRLSRKLITACLVLTAIPAGVDLFTKHLNPSMLYVIPLLVLSKTGRRKYLFPYTALAVFLTFAFYVLDHVGEPLLTSRLLNRTMAAIALCVVAASLYLWIGVRERLMNLWEAQSDKTTFDDMSESLMNLTAFFISVFLIICIALADFATPGQFNLPILYAIPLVIAHWMGSRRLLWILLPILITVGVLGYMFGPPPQVTSDRLGYIIANRTIAMAALVVVAVMLHFFIRPDWKRPS